MAPNEIKAVEMVRCIRDRHHELLKDRTPEERTAFYEAKAKKAMERAEAASSGAGEDGAK